MEKLDSLKIKFALKLISLAESPPKKFKSRPMMPKTSLTRKSRERDREDLDRTDLERIGQEDQENTTMKGLPEEIEILKTDLPEEIMMTDLPEEIEKIMKDLLEETEKTREIMKEEKEGVEIEKEKERERGDPEEITKIEIDKKEDLL